MKKRGRGKRGQEVEWRGEIANAASAKNGKSKIKDTIVCRVTIVFHSFQEAEALSVSVSLFFSLTLTHAHTHSQSLSLSLASEQYCHESNARNTDRQTNPKKEEEEEEGKGLISFRHLMLGRASMVVMTVAAESVKWRGL